MKLTSAVFYSHNIEAVIPFYRDVLSLEMTERQGERFVKFRFDNGVELGIKRAMEDREKPGSQTIFVESEDIESDFQTMKNAGATFGKEMVHQPWGSEFSVLDADSNKVLFIQHSI